MPRITVVIGFVLILLGVPFFLAQFAEGDGKLSWTPFIPAIPGLLLVGLGLLAGAKPTWRKHVMHVVMLLALLLVIGGLAMGLPGLIAFLTGGEAARPLAALEQVLMALVSLLLLGLGIKSFVDARRSGATSSTSNEPMKVEE